MPLRRFEQIWRFVVRGPYPVLFIVAFLVCASLTVRALSPIHFWPGDHDGYSAYCTMLVAHGPPTADAAGLYDALRPWRADSLLSTIAGFVAARGVEPTKATHGVMIALYFIGTPLVTAWILRQEKRSPWGAILTFPVLYSHAWSRDSYPFALSAPFFLLAIFSFVRLMRSSSSGAADGGTGITARTTIQSFASITLLALTCRQTLVWCLFCCGILWLGFLVDRLRRAPGDPPLPKRLRELGLRTVVAVFGALPALSILRASWRGTDAWFGAAGPAALWDGRFDFLREKMIAAMPSLLVMRSPDEASQVVLFLGVIAFCFAMRVAGPRERAPIPEVLFAVTVVSFFLLPERTPVGEPFGPRQLDIALWLLPLCITPALRPPHRAFNVATAAAILYYAHARLPFLWTNLATFDAVELGGLDQIAGYAQSDHARVTQVTFGSADSPNWIGARVDRSFAYLAARHGYDAPELDLGLHPHQYATTTPSVRLSNVAGFWSDPDLWREFDVVLTYRFSPSTETRIAMDPVASSVGHFGPWELWRRRTPE